MRRHHLTLFEAASLDDLAARVSQAARRQEPGSWILGRGFYEAEWPQPSLPTRQELDVAAPSHPVLLFRRDMHLAAANSRALKLARLTDETPDPPGGVIDRDESGRLNGILREKAIDLVEGVVPPADEAEAVAAMQALAAEMNRLGLTGVHDARMWGGLEGAAAFRAWQRLRQSGGLNLRCWMFLPGERLEEAVGLGLRTGFGDRQLRLGHLKFFSDGSVGARTAWLLEPYLDAGAGLPLLPVDQLARAIQRADEAGLAVAVHAIGDRANRELVGVFEAVKRRRAKSRSMPLLPAPHRIEHVQMIRPDDLSRLARLGVVTSVQPLHVTDDIVVHEQSLGSRGRWVYPFRSMIEAGVPLIFGSDCPVADPNPLWGVHAAVTRRRRDKSPEKGWHPEQRLSVAEAVWAYTMGPALACSREDELGSLSEGKLADVVVLNGDVFAMDPMDIPQVEVDMTIFEGRVVYAR